MKIYWYNDGKEPLSIYVDTFSNLVETIEPLTGTYIDINVPHTKDLFIKNWKNIVFIGLSEKDIFND